MDQLQKIAKHLVAPGKGILAADESLGTIKKRFDKIGVESTEENRRDWRELLFTTKGMEEFISGVIEFDETMRQKAGDGTPLPKVLENRSVIPGIKVDEGKDPLPESPNESLTKGLDGLPDQLKEYHDLGARFAKWRAVINIGNGLPTEGAIQKNAEALAQFAKMSQEAGLVPIVEPEVLMDGDHSIERCEEVTKQTLTKVYEELDEAGVDLEGSLLKPNMVLSGKDSAKRATSQEIAEATLRTLKETVPAAVPGIVFLSGGQSEQEATVNLNELNKLKKPSEHPWELSFSYGRALQNTALLTWAGKSENVESAQKEFYKRARLNSLARYGKYETG